MRRKFLSATEFKGLVKSGEIKSDSGRDDIVVVKSFGEIEKNAGPDEKRSVRFTISTAAVDREGDSISIDGWDLSNFRKNPVVLFGHNYRSMPVASAPEIGIANNALWSVAEFPPAGEFAFSDMIYRATAGIKRPDGSVYRLLRTASVGMMPRKWAYVDEPGRWGIDFLEQELLEWSIVPVPANAEALADNPDEQKGIDALYQQLQPVHIRADGTVDPAELARSLSPLLDQLRGEKAPASSPDHIATLQAELDDLKRKLFTRNLEAEVASIRRPLSV